MNPYEKSCRRILDAPGGMHEDWIAVGRQLSQAMVEVAFDLGGDDFAAKVSILSESRDALPGVEALKLLESNYPGSGKTVFDRMEHIGEEQRAKEISEVTNVRGYGRSVIAGIIYPRKKR